MVASSVTTVMRHDGDRADVVAADGRSRASDHRADFPRRQRAPNRTGADRPIRVRHGRHRGHRFAGTMRAIRTRDDIADPTLTASLIATAVP